MPPKASAFAKQEDPCPILKLLMEKGPLSGRTMNFEPGSTIRIGRIIRGNTVSIKDAGISSKHLLIQSEPAAELGRRRWTIMDLDSSNGTFLNGSQIVPSAPTVLTDGDVIKIGENTAIKVEFEVSDVASECNSENVRRNPRRRAKNGRVELGVIDENSEFGRGGDDQKSGFDLRNSNGNLGAENEGKMDGRRTRGSKARERGNDVVEVGVVEILGKASLRRPRVLSKEENSERKTDIVDEVEGKGRRNRGLRTRNPEDEELFEAAKETRDVGLQRAKKSSNRNSSKVESFDETGVVIEGKFARKGTMGGTCSYVEAPLELKEEDELTGKGINSGSEDCAGFASMSGANENMSRTEGGVVDLEKMTLGEWFEFLEIYMPKQIIHVTEEMITGMKQKVEKLHEFMSHQKNAKAMDEVAR